MADLSTHRFAPAGMALLSLAVVAFAAPALSARADSPPIVATPEPVFRRLITKLVMPTYPVGASRRGEKGPAVAEVLVDEEGRVTEVQMLDAPSEEIGEAVIKAVRQSKFTPATSDNGAVRLRGKLTFYFVLEGGKARVENPRKFK